ncbi:MAG: glycosyltransferase family 4 protein [Synechococcaceae cyanobacterium]|nr:glycosyltransferase family 4 protein [Synechococcaceae cyanobacterium]
MSLHLDASRKFGDSERRVLSLLQGLVRRGHSVLLCGPRTSALHREARHHGIPCEPLTLRSGLDFPSVVRLARLVRSQAFDLVHAHDATSHRIAMAAQELSGDRALEENLFVTHRSFPDERGAGENPAYGTARVHHIVTSRPLRDALVQRGADPTHVAIVPDGVDLQSLRAASADGDDPWKLRERGRRVVGTTGRWTREREMDLLLQAFRLVHRRLPETHLLVAGERPPAVTLERRLRELGITDAVTWTGSLEDRSRLHGTLDVFIVPLDQTVAPTRLLEAMAAGTPVVTAALPTVMALVRHGTSALVVPPRDAQALAQSVTLVLEQPDLAARLVQGATAVAEQYSVDRMVDATLQAYRALGRPETAPPKP